MIETFLQGLLQGSPEVREAAADAIGEAVALTPAAALRPFVVKITGPLIRIVGDRFAPPVKAAILRALGAVIGKAGPGLKPFVPQLQTTFLKCLPAPEPEIRMQACCCFPQTFYCGVTGRVQPLLCYIAPMHPRTMCWAVRRRFPVSCWNSQPSMSCIAMYQKLTMYVASLLRTLTFQDH